MTKLLLYGASAALGLLSLFGSLTARAAIDAKITFETEIPKAFVCGENSTIELSDRHFKDGRQSLHWSWTAPSTLRYNDFGELISSFRVKGAGIMLWIYNPVAADADLHFAFGWKCRCGIVWIMVFLPVHTVGSMFLPLCLLSVVSFWIRWECVLLGWEHAF